MDSGSALVLRSALVPCFPIEDPKTGQRKHGVPPGGPWDSQAWHLAEALTGGQAGWELTGTREGHWAELQARESCLVALIAEGFGIEGDGGFQLRTPCAVAVPRNASLSIVGQGGFRLTLCSRPQPHIGGGSKLIGSKLALSLPLETELPFFGSPGLDLQGEVGLDISRVGMRLLKGGPPTPALSHSEPSILGAIQATPSGDILIHGPEGPTIGGYTKLGCLGAMALSHLARIGPGQEAVLVGDPERARSFEKDQREWTACQSEALTRIRELGILQGAQGSG